MVFSSTRAVANITCQKHSFLFAFNSHRNELGDKQSEERGEVQNKELGSFVKILFLKLCEFKKWHFYIKKKKN